MNYIVIKIEIKINLTANKNIYNMEHTKIHDSIIAYNEELIKSNSNVTIKEYIQHINKINYNIDSSLIDELFELTTRHDCCIPHTYLEKYEVIKLNDSNKVLRLLKKYDFTENIDYTLILDKSKRPQGGTYNANIYYLTPKAFKEIIIGLRDNNKFRKYYLLLEVCIKYYTDLQSKQLEQSKIREQILLDKLNKINHINKELNNTINILTQNNDSLNTSMLLLKQELTLFKSQYSINVNTTIPTDSNLKLEYTFLVFKNNNKSFNYITRIINILRNQDTINKITYNNEYKLITKIYIFNNYINFIKYLYEQLSKVMHFKAQEFTIINKSINEAKVIEIMHNLYNDWIFQCEFFKN